MPADAADGEMVAETATRRLTTRSAPAGEDVGGLPYTELFTDMVVETSPAGAVVVDLTPADTIPSSPLTRLLQRRQLSFIAWGG